MSIKHIIFWSGIVFFLANTATFAQVSHIGPDLPIIGNGILASQFVKAGNDAAGRGSLREAKANYQNAIGVSPFDEDATLGLARCAAAEGNLKLALGYYQSAIQGHHEEDNIDVETEYILVLAQAGHSTEVIPLYNHIVSLCQKGRVITPMEIMPPTFRLDGSDYDSNRLQAMTHMIRAMNSSNSDDKRIILEMQKAISLEPDSAICQFSAGVLLSRSDKGEAKKAFQRALNLDDGSNAKTISKWIVTTK